MEFLARLTQDRLLQTSRARIRVEDLQFGHGLLVEFDDLGKIILRAWPSARVKP